MAFRALSTIKKKIRLSTAKLVYKIGERAFRTLGHFKIGLLSIGFTFVNTGFFTVNLGFFPISFVFFFKYIVLYISYIFWHLLKKNNIKVRNILLIFNVCLLLVTAYLLQDNFCLFIKVLVVNMNGQRPSNYNSTGSGPNFNPGNGNGNGPGPGGVFNTNALLDQLERTVRDARNKFKMSIGYILNNELPK